MLISNELGYVFLNFKGLTMMKNIFFFILGLLFCSNVIAREMGDFFVNQCPGISKNIKAVYLWGNKSGDISRCDIVGDYSKAIESISKFAELPPSINLSLYEKQAGASFGDSNNLLSIAKELLSVNSETKEEFTRSRIGNVTTFVHEYGHAIFANWLKRDFPEYKKVSDEQKDSAIASTELYFYSDRRSTLGLRLEEFDALGSYDSEEYNRIQLEYNEVSRALAMSFSMNNGMDNSEASKNQKVHNLISPYTEMFADLVTVLNSNDPKAMYKAIAYPNMVKRDQVLAEGRDFSIIHNLETWDSKVGHILLAPARGYLYSEFLSGELSLDKKREVLELVFVAMKEEILLRWGSEIEDVVLSNRELINRFDQSLIR